MLLSLQLNLFGGARDPSRCDDDVTFDESIKNSKFNLNQTLKEHQHTTQRCCVCLPDAEGSNYRPPIGLSSRPFL